MFSSRPAPTFRIGGIPVWAQAPVIDDFHQYDPVDHGEPTERTEVYVLYDDDNLYVAVRMFDSEPSQIRARQMVQGQAMWFDDSFSILLDPFNNKRTGYSFQVNPVGNRRDGIFETPTEQNQDWRVSGTPRPKSTMKAGRPSFPFRSKP